MKIVFLTTKPVRLHSGSEVRNYYLIRSLLKSRLVERLTVEYCQIGAKETDIKITDDKLVINVRPLDNRRFIDSIIAFIKGNLPYIDVLRNNKYTNLITQSIRDADVVLISELDGYHLVASTISQLGEAKIVLDCHNVDYIRLQSEIEGSSQLKRLLFKRLSGVVRELERDALRHVDMAVACSVPDQKILSELSPQSRITLIPNGVELSHDGTRRQKGGIYNILFLGTLSYPPNSEGIIQYIRKIHPLVRKKCPTVRLNVVGKEPPKSLIRAAENDETITLHGFVDNLEQVIVSADVCICPLLSGSGTRLKILEYMGAGKAVVSTSLGCQGINVTDGKDILIADSPTEFASSVVTLLQDKELANRMGVKARELIKDYYTWENLGKKLNDTIKSIL